MLAKFGIISEVDPQTHRARVYFPDLDITSALIPVIVPNTKDNHDEYLPDIDEHVFCIIQDNSGIILGSIYDDKNTPPVGNQDHRVITFKDGTRIYYDRDNHVMDITDCNGNIIHMDKNGIDFTACKDFTGNISGDATITAGGNITIKAGGNVKILGTRIDLNQ